MVRTTDSTSVSLGLTTNPNKSSSNDPMLENINGTGTSGNSTRTDTTSGKGSTNNGAGINGTGSSGTQPSSGGSIQKRKDSLGTSPKLF